CTKLVDIHPSIAVLKSLKVLNLRDCKSLRTLPTKIGMESLEALILWGCSSLVRFSEIDGKMERLKTLDLSGCYRVENLLENLQQAKLLEELDGNDFISIPASLTRLSKLANLILSNCNMCTFGEADTHYDISGLSSLSYLDFSGNNLISIPASLTRLSKLHVLDLSNCNVCTLGEADIRSDLSSLSSLICLDLSGKNFITILLDLTEK
ncbi:hypothetical protein Gotri_019736, partial [Gossypium trilobum]|nr:hypothetical protein [Gossypium trilobum]